MMLKNGLIHQIMIKKDKRLFPIGKNKKILGHFKDKLDGEIMKEFIAPRAKTYAYLIRNDSGNKKPKGTKKYKT